MIPIGAGSQQFKIKTNWNRFMYSILAIEYIQTERFTT